MPEQFGDLGHADSLDESLGREGMPDRVADEVLQVRQLGPETFESAKRMFCRVNAVLSTRTPEQRPLRGIDGSAYGSVRPLPG